MYNPLIMHLHLYDKIKAQKEKKSFGANWQLWFGCPISFALCISAL